MLFKQFLAYSVLLFFFEKAEDTYDCFRPMLRMREYWWRGNDEECEGARHSREQVAHFVHRFSSHFDAVHFEDFVAFVEEARLVGSAAAHDPADHHGIAFIPHCSSLGTKENIENYTFG